MVKKEEFLKVYDSHKPSKAFDFLLLFFRQKKHPLYFIYLALAGCSFIIMMGYAASENDIGTYPQWPTMMKLSFWIFAGMTVTIVVAGYILGFIDNIRIRKICKKLKIPIKEYGYYVDLYC